jgi:hypothetical protein
LVPVGDSPKYNRLKTSWLHTIASDPVTYVQNKILFAGKLLIGSDSRNLSFATEKSSWARFLAIYRIPYDAAISLHLYSLFSTILILLLLPIKRYLRREAAGIEIERVTINLFTGIIIWLGLSSIAYIGSNGRYTYAISILSMIVYVAFWRQHEEFVYKRG